MKHKSVDHIKLDYTRNYLKLYEEQAGILDVDSRKLIMRIHAYNYTLRYNSSQDSDFFLFVRKQPSKKKRYFIRKGVSSSISVNTNNILFITRFAREHRGYFTKLLHKYHLAYSEFGSQDGPYVILHKSFYLTNVVSSKALAKIIIQILQCVNTIIDGAYRYRQVQFATLNQDAFDNIDPKSYLTQQQGKQLDQELKMLLNYFHINNEHNTSH